uniref:Uncharacterized protein n=1 Tax=Panagrolaimus superbus TaxID=310955 RepID=A0A914YWM0_9BILA
MMHLFLLLLISFFQHSFQKENCLSVDIVETEGRPTTPTWYSEIDLAAADPTSECPNNPCRSLDDFYDSYNLIEIKKHLLWLRRTRENSKEKTTEEASAEKFEHDSAALIEQNAVLPVLFPLKIPSTSMYGTSKTNLTVKESEHLTEKTAKCDDDTLIDWTASEAQKDYNQRAAELRKKLQPPKKPVTAIATTPQRSSAALELENTQLSSESTQTSLPPTTNLDKTQSDSIRKRNL